MNVRARLATTAQDEHEARRIEERVFGEAFGNTPEQLSAEYAPYEGASLFLLCSSGPSAPAEGVARLIAPSTARLKTLVDIEAEPWSVDGDTVASAAGLDLDRTWDVATLAVLPHARQGAVSFALYSALLGTMTSAGALSWTAIVDTKVLVLLRRAGVSVDPLPGLRPAPYLGSVSSVPVYGHLAETRLGNLARA